MKMRHVHSNCKVLGLVMMSGVGCFVLGNSVPSNGVEEVPRYCFRLTEMPGRPLIEPPSRAEFCS